MMPSLRVLMYIAIAITIGRPLSATADAFIISRDLGPDDLVHERSYSTVGGYATFFTESLHFQQDAGTISSGDLIDIRLNFVGPLQLESFYPDQAFHLSLHLVKGTISSGGSGALEADFALLGTEALTYDTTLTVWNVTTAAQHRASVAITPTETMARFSGLTWSYTAPAWMAPGTPMRFEFLLRISKRAILPDVLPDPQRDLIRFLPTLLIGDANNDGVVDAADFAAIEQNFGLTGVDSGYLPGDANDDGRVDALDYLFVERHFGATLATPSVPEPAVALPLLLAAWLVRRRRA